MRFDNPRDSGIDEDRKEEERERKRQLRATRKIEGIRDVDYYLEKLNEHRAGVWNED